MDPTLRADLVSFAKLLEAEWYNGNCDERAFERLNADLTGIIAKFDRPGLWPGLALEAALDRVWHDKFANQLMPPYTAHYRLGYHAAIEDAKRVVLGGEWTGHGWFYSAESQIARAAESQS